MSRCDSTLWLLQSRLPKTIWLVFSVTGGSDGLHLVVVTSSSLSEPLGVQFLPTSYLSLFLDWLVVFVFLVWDSALQLKLSLPPSSSPAPSFVQHSLPLFPYFYLYPSLQPPPLYPSTAHSTSTQYGLAEPLEGQHTFSCLPKIFLHQGWRHKPHALSVVALGGKYLLNFCRCPTF